jgi:hypothetical protein
VAELRAATLGRIDLMQRRAFEALDADPSPHWLTIAAGLEKLRVDVEGTRAPPKRPVLEDSEPSPRTAIVCNISKRITAAG